VCAYCITTSHRSKRPEVQDVFIGYHVDTPASVVNHICRMIGRLTGDQMWKEEVRRYNINDVI